MKYTAMVFLHGFCFQAQGNTPERALEELQESLIRIKKNPTLTYQPSNGRIYNDSHIPCGVIFQKGIR